MSDSTAYEGALADYFAGNATDGPYNAHTDRPAMLALAGDVAGLRVLDVGCGAGHYIAELRARGVQPAQVQAALRIAAVVHAVGRVLAAEAVDHPPFSGV